MIVRMRIASVAWGLLSLLLAFMCFTALSMLGFPDGYITPYDIATRQLKEVMNWLIVAQGLYSLCKGLVGRRLRPEGLVLQIGLVMALIFVPIGVVDSCPRWDMCTRAYEAMTGNFMDDGTGG